ncbi:MAG: hypothetical protein RL226_1395, partial [Bacteroidota bacterium]
MKWIKRIVILLLAVLVVSLGVGYYIFRKPIPKYEGSLPMTELTANVDVQFDSYGIPHIHASNSTDGYRVLGYLMASERLFQMEMLRRVGSGRLAEIIGDKGLSADLFFRSSGLHEKARVEAQKMLEEGGPIASECTAFIEGINTFILEDNLPVEFTLAGIEPTPFTIEDMYYCAGYMAYSFALAAQTDLLATELEKQHGADWLYSLGLSGESIAPFNPSCLDDTTKTLFIPNVLEEAGIAPFEGSNAWAIAGKNTESGKPIFCNDTHIGYGIPQVWYEAELTFDDFHFYGNFIPGIPYALVGHNHHHTWGLTMFENDDIDFCRILETDNGYKFEGQELAFVERQEIIHVKDLPDTSIVVRETIFGPIMNDGIASLALMPPVSMRWEYTQGENQLLHAFRSMAHAVDFNEFESSIAKIHAPGLNVVYADTADNIAWWACARIPIRPEGYQSKLIQSGSDSSSLVSSYRPFNLNPHCVNPPAGIVSSANEQSITPDSIAVPGYFVPPARAKRIRELLVTRDDWNSDDIKAVMLDVKQPLDAEIAYHLKTELEKLDVEWTDFEKSCIELLDWEGDYHTSSATPVLFTPLQVALLREGLKDEMSPEQFDRFCTTHWMRRALYLGLTDSEHVLWDVITTE